jgi:hypothetical protein
MAYEEDTMEEGITHSPVGSLSDDVEKKDPDAIMYDSKVVSEGSVKEVSIGKDGYFDPEQAGKW